MNVNAITEVQMLRNYRRKKNDCVPLQTQPLKEKILFKIIITRI